LSLQLVEEMLLERGIVVLDETVRRWPRGSDRTAPAVASARGRAGAPVGISPMVISLGGEKHWLGWAVDQDG